MAIRYFTSTYVELLSTDPLPRAPLYGLRARYVDTNIKKTFNGTDWISGWYMESINAASHDLSTLPRITWMALVNMATAGSLQKWDRFFIIDLGTYIEIAFKSPDGSSWIEDINDVGQITHKKIQ